MTFFLMRYSLQRQRSPFRIPETWPTPSNRRANRELAFICFPSSTGYFDGARRGIPIITTICSRS